MPSIAEPSPVATPPVVATPVRTIEPEVFASSTPVSATPPPQSASAEVSFLVGLCFDLKELMIDYGTVPDCG